MKIRILEGFAVIFLVIALIDAANYNYGYGSSYRKGYGSGNSFRGRVRTSNRVRGSKDMSNTQLRTAILLGTVFGASSWKRRSNFKHKGELPQICYNEEYDIDEYDVDINHLGLVSYEGRFVCPTDDTMGDGESFCCGQESQQYCCTFWGNDWRLAGVVGGIVVFAGIVFVLSFCIIKGRARKVFKFCIKEGIEGIEQTE